MSGSFLKGAVVGLVCALIGGATVALAGSGVGGVFNLGVSNSVDAKTTLTGASSGIQLQVTNTNAAGRNGLAVNSANGFPTGAFTNTASGPAGAFTVSPGVAPFTVSSNTKVGNLNADRLDGLDSTAFLSAATKASDADKLDGLDSNSFTQGFASRTMYVKRMLADDFLANVTLLDLGWVQLFARCSGSSGGAIGVSVPAGSDPVDVGVVGVLGDDRFLLTFPHTPVSIFSFDALGGTEVMQVGQTYRLGGVGLPRSRMATFIVSARGDTSGRCLVQAQALAQGF